LLKDQCITLKTIAKLKNSNYLIFSTFGLTCQSSDWSKRLRGIDYRLHVYSDYAIDRHCCQEPRQEKQGFRFRRKTEPLARGAMTTSALGTSCFPPAHMFSVGPLFHISVPYLRRPHEARNSRRSFQLGLIMIDGENALKSAPKRGSVKPRVIPPHPEKRSKSLYMLHRIYSADRSVEPR
jgi:hypothetical protein